LGVLGEAGDIRRVGRRSTCCWNGKQ
jgi:hypothetical protein